MSAEEEIVAAAAAAGLPAARMAWPEGSAPELPWCAFYLENQNSFFADGVVYAEVCEWCVELYHKQSDGQSERRLEAELSAAFGAWSKSEAWIEDEGCVQTSYLFSTIEKKGQ